MAAWRAMATRLPKQNDTTVMRPWASLGLDLVSLRLFLATANEGSLGRAAQRESISLSAISRRISDLESRTAVTLFERHDRGMILTAAGEALAGHVRVLFDRLDEMVDDLHKFQKEAKGHVRICHISAAASMLPKVIASFLAKHGHIDVQVDETTTFETSHAIRCGRADLGLVSSGHAFLEDLFVMPWREDELVLILPPDHPLSAKKALQFEDVLGEPLIGWRRDETTLSQYERYADSVGVSLKIRAHAGSFESIRQMVAEGLGCALVPANAARPYAGELGIEVRSLSEAWARRWLMICVRDPNHLSASATLVVEHLLDLSPCARTDWIHGGSGFLAEVEKDFPLG